jgi:PKD repeat protein
MTDARRLGFAVAAAAALAACPQRVKPPTALVAFVGAGATLDCKDADAGPATGRIGAPVLLHAGCSTDPQAMHLTFSWSLAELPPGSRATLNSASLQAPSFAPDQAGTYRVRLVVSNGILTAADDAQVEVPACGVQAPAVTEVRHAPATPQTGEQVALATTIADADNDAACDAKQTFTHQWALVRQPPGSTAALNSTASATPSFRPDREGDYDLRVVATDSTGRASTPVVHTVTVGECGARTPAIDEIAADPVAPGIGATVQLTPTVDDADTTCTPPPGDTFSYAWSLSEMPRGSGARLNDATVREPSFVADIAGDYVVRLVVTDAAGHVSEPATLTITASACGGGAPAVTAITFAPASPNTGQLVQATPAIADADTDPGTCALAESFLFDWRLVAQPAGSTARLNNAAAESPSLTADLPGEYALRLVVTDASGHKSPARTERVTVAVCGSALPTVAPTASTATPRTGETVQLEAAADDADADPSCAAHAPVFTYHWWFAEIPAGSAAALNDAGTRDPSFLADVPGTYRVRVTATDPTGKVSAVGEVSLDADACGNAAPTVAPTGPTDPNTGELVALDAAAGDTDTDPACDAHPAVFIYHWWFSEMPGGSAARLNDAGTARPSFTPDVPGAYLLRVTATDPTGRASAAGEVTVDAQACGSAAPAVTIAAAAGSSAAPNTGARVQLEAGVTDSDTDVACAAHAAVYAYAWSFVELPPGSAAALNDAASKNPTFTADVPGKYVLRAAATDPTGKTGTADDFTVTAASCGSAVPSVTVQQLLPASGDPTTGARTQMDAAVVDTDTGCGAHAAVFTYAWAFTELPSGSAARLNDAAARNPSFTPDVPGVYKLVAAATDPTGRTGKSPATTVTAAACGSAAPTAAITAPASANTGAVVLLDGTGSSDTDNTGCTPSLGQTLAFAWRFSELPSGSRATLNDAASRKPSFTADVNGTYVVELVVTDSTGRASAPKTASITILACGSVTPNVPVANMAAAPSAAPAVGQAVRLSATPVDTDTTCGGHGPITEFSWRFDVLPAGSRATFNDSAAANPSFTPDVDGTYTVRVLVTDPTGRSGLSDPFNVVASVCGTNKPTITNALANGVDPLNANAGTGVQLSATGVQDADTQAGCGSLAQTLTYRWRLLEVPAGSRAVLTDSSAEKPAFATDAVGTYVAELVVTDSTGRASLPNTVNVVTSMCGNHRPIGDIDKMLPATAVDCTGGTTNAAVGSTVQVDAQGGIGSPASSSDPDNTGCGLATPQQLFFNWTLLTTPSGSTNTLSNRQGRNTWFGPVIAGSYIVRLQITDSTGLESDAVQCTINVP